MRRPSGLDVSTTGAPNFRLERPGMARRSAARWASAVTPGGGSLDWDRGYVAAFVALRRSVVKTLLPASLFARSPGAGGRPGRGARFASGLVQRGRAHPEAAHRAGRGTGSPLLGRDDPIPSRASRRRLGATDSCRSTRPRASLSCDSDSSTARPRSSRAPPAGPCPACLPPTRLSAAGRP